MHVDEHSSVTFARNSTPVKAKLTNLFNLRRPSVCEVVRLFPKPVHRNQLKSAPDVTSLHLFTLFLLNALERVLSEINTLPQNEFYAFTVHRF